MAMTIDRKIETSYRKAMTADRQIAAIEAAARKGTATLKDAGIYASKAGTRTGRALAEVLEDLVQESEDDIVTIVKDALRRGHADTVRIIEAAIAHANEEAGVNLKAITAAFDEDRAAGLARMIIEAEDPAALIDKLGELAENLTLSGLDESVRKNAEFQDGSGLETTVIRTYDGIGLHGNGERCEWCLERAGTWSYADAVANGIFERHPGCQCEIEYVSKKTHTRSRGGGWV